ncbi:DUF72 domain-containing protein [Sphingomonas sp.]|jgi:uncharacterized protein YecE (DUF72 family)|uniref:DUF72 domain-containing protein n=1 Tax=Sphingomonas sp. TaxID=28214 RepID=UPI002DF6F788|nr:DUF72 domain-containing protein [Sphingomonas sp.]
MRIGTAGWAIPRQTAERFPAEGTTLERYAARFGCAEINSTFHRSHRASTFERWAASVPEGFRLSVKVPKTITHQAKLAGCGELVRAFLGEIAPLGDWRGPLLVQLPPSLAFDVEVAATFFAQLPRPAVCEPRHASWFTEEADALLAGWEIGRAAADPQLHEGAARPGGWPGLAYFRLHGSPRTYWSSYEPDALLLWAERVRLAHANAGETWVIFDNTAGGAAAANALDLAALLGA